MSLNTPKVCSLNIKVAAVCVLFVMAGTANASEEGVLEYYSEFPPSTYPRHVVKKTQRATEVPTPGQQVSAQPAPSTVVPFSEAMNLYFESPDKDKIRPLVEQAALRNLFSVFVMYEPRNYPWMAPFAQLPPEYQKEVARQRNAEYREVLGPSRNPEIQALLQVDAIDFPLEMKSRLLALWDDIATNRLSIEEAKRIASNNTQFLSRLIRMQERPNYMFTLLVSREAQEATARIIHGMDQLHYAPDAEERAFRGVRKIPAAELVAMLAYGEGELRSWTFNGLFDVLAARLRTEHLSGDQLLLHVQPATFRSFIKMTVRYNRLNEFLKKTMPKEARPKLMKRFVSKLEQDPDFLSEAAAVADTLNVLEDQTILQVLRNQIAQEYRRVAVQNNRSGQILYSLLGEILGQKDPTHVQWLQQMAVKHKIPNMSEIALADLFPNEVDVQQVFFYNDQDGPGFFQHFLDQYKGKQAWKIDQGHSPYVVVRSTVGRKIEIYANRPTHQEDGPAAIQAAVQAQHRQVSLAVHLSHSYHVNMTIDRLPSSTKLFYGGSCGSLNQLSVLLAKLPKGQYVLTRGPATAEIDDTVLSLLNEKLRTGKGSVVRWKSFRAQTQADPRLGKEVDFKNYVFPNEDMSTLFLRVYLQMISSHDNLPRPVLPLE